MASLSNTKIKDTYQSLVKFSDNGNITIGAKRLTDGFGNNSPLYVSTTQIGIGITPQSGYGLHVSSDVKIGSNLEVSGNLTVNGTLTYLNVVDLEVDDPLIQLAVNNAANILDIGLFGKYDSSGTKYKGLFNDASDDKFKLFTGLTQKPLTTVNTSATGYTKGNLVIGGLEATSGTFSGNLSANNLSGTNTGDQTLPTDFVSKANGGTFGGDITIAKTDPTITLYDNSGANTDPNGKIIFSEVANESNFEISYNGLNDRLEFNGLISGTSTDLVYINRSTTTALSVLGGASFTGQITGNLTGNVTGDVTGNAYLNTIAYQGGEGTKLDNSAFNVDGIGTTFRWIESNSGATGTTWKKVADVVCASGTLPSGVQMEVKVLQPNVNDGSSASLNTIYYSIAFRGRIDDGNEYNNALVYGQDSDLIRVYKSASLTFELQARSNDDNRDLVVECNITSKKRGKVTPTTTYTNGTTTGGTAYTASGNALNKTKFAGNVEFEGAIFDSAEVEDLRVNELLYFGSGATSGYGPHISHSDSGVGTGKGMRITVDSDLQVWGVTGNAGEQNQGLYVAGGVAKLYDMNGVVLETVLGGVDITGTLDVTANIETTNGVLNIYKFTNTSSSNDGTTLLSLTNNVGTDLTDGDLQQQKTFIDFNLLDANANEYPQVRIGAEVGQNGNANTQILEGSGAFVVYTNNATGNGPGTPTGLAENLRVDWEGTTTTPRIRLSGASDASITSTNHGFQVGSTDTANIIADGNEIMARNNGAVSPLAFNPDGGDVTFGGNVNASTMSGSGNLNVYGHTTTTELNLPSGGQIEWDSGDARIVEGLVNNFSLSFQTYNGTAIDTALRLDGNNTAHFSGQTTIKSNDGLVLYTETSEASLKPKITFSTLPDNPVQFGVIEYTHLDSLSQGGGHSFSFVGEDDANDNLVIMAGDGTKTGTYLSTSRGSTNHADFGFYGDINTGMYRPADHVLGFLANGSRKININSTTVAIQNATLTAGAINSSASITASGNSNSFGNTTVGALTASSGTFSASVTAGGNSNSFGTTTITNLTTTTSFAATNSIIVNSTGTAGLYLRGDSNNSGDTGQLDSVIQMTQDVNLYGMELGTYNFSGWSEFALKQLKTNGSGGFDKFTIFRTSLNNDLNVGGLTKDGSTVWRRLGVGVTASMLSRETGTADAMFSNNLYIGSDNVDKRLVDGGAARIFINDNVTRFQYAAVSTANSGVSWSESMRIKGNNGFVGIGDTDPAYRLTVFHPTSNVVAKFESGDTAVWIDLHDNNSSTYGVLLGAQGTDFIIAPNNTQVVRVKENGRVGINTTDPGSSLEIFGGGNTLRMDSAGNTAKTFLMRNVNTAIAEIKTDGNLDFNIEDGNRTMRFLNGDTERMRLTSSGLLGIGTGASVGADIHIKRAGDASIIIEADSDNVGENDNPTLFLRQDGAIITSRYGINGDANNQFTGAIGNAAYIHAMGAIQLAPDGGLISATFKDGAMLIDGTAGEVPSYKLDIRNAGSSGINITGTGAFVRWNSGDMQIKNAGGYKMEFDTWNGSSLTEKMSITGNGVVRANVRLDVGSTTWTGYGSNPIGKLNVETPGNNAINIFNTNEGYAYLKFIDSQSNGSQYSHVGWSSGAGNPFVIENMGTSAIYITNAGNIGIKKTSSISYALDVSGSIRATSDVIAFSDRRVKKDIVTVNNALNKVVKLRGVTYKRSDVPDNKTKLGVIAQEVLDVLPEVVEKDDNGLYSVAYGNMAGVFIEAIKELKAEVDSLKQELKQFKK